MCSRSEGQHIGCRFILVEVRISYVQCIMGFYCLCTVRWVGSKQEVTTMCLWVENLFEMPIRGSLLPPLYSPYRFIGRFPSCIGYNRWSRFPCMSYHALSIKQMRYPHVVGPFKQSDWSTPSQLIDFPCGEDTQGLFSRQKRSQKFFCHASKLLH